MFRIQGFLLKWSVSVGKWLIHTDADIRSGVADDAQYFFFGES